MTPTPPPATHLTREQCIDYLQRERDYHESNDRPGETLMVEAILAYLRQSPTAPATAGVAPAGEAVTQEEREALTYAIAKLDNQTIYWHSRQQTAKLYCAFRERGNEAARIAATLRQLLARLGAVGEK